MRGIKSSLEDAHPTQAGVVILGIPLKVVYSATREFYLSPGKQALLARSGAKSWRVWLMPAQLGAFKMSSPVNDFKISRRNMRG